MVKKKRGKKKGKLLRKVSSKTKKLVQPRTPKKPKKCVFCEILKGKYHIEKIWENKEFIAFLDQYPLERGHTLLIPKKHIDYIFDLEDKSYESAFKYAKKIAKPLRKAMKCKKIVMGVEGFMVPHVHIHLVPSNDGGWLAHLRRKNITHLELVKTADKIRKEIKKSKIR